MKYKTAMTDKLKINIFILKNIAIFLLIISLTQIFFFLRPSSVEATTLQELANSISKLSTDEQNLLGEVVAAETQIEQKEREIKNYQEQLDNFEIELKDLYAKTTQLEKNMSGIKAKIQESAIKAYKYGNNDVAKLIISARSLNEIATVIYIYRRMIRENNSLMEELKSEKERYEMTFRKSEDTKNKISELKDKLIKEKDALTVYLADKQNLLSKVKRDHKKRRRPCDLRLRFTTRVYPRFMNMKRPTKTNPTPITMLRIPAFFTKSIVPTFDLATLKDAFCQPAD